ncbi:MAG: O-antigen ligase family protein [Alphaproteobacteria bacterium]
MIPAALVVLFVAAGLIAVAAEPNFATPAALAGVLIPVLLLRRRALAKASEATPVLIALALFVATVWAAAFWGLAGPLDLAERAGKITLFALAGGIALCLPVSGRGAVTVLIGLALGATAVALALAENSLVGALADLFVPAEAGELEAVFIRANLHKAPAVVLALVFFPLALLALSARGRNAGLAIWAPAGVTAAGVAISGHETALLALAAGASAAGLAYWTPRLVGGLVLMTVGFLMFAAPSLLHNGDLKPLLDATRASTSLQHRVLIADFAAARIAEKPVLGWGLDSARAMPDGSKNIAETPSRLARFAVDDLTPKVWSRGQNMPLHPHNMALQIRLELGLPGAAAALILLAAGVAGVVRLQSARGRAMAFGMMATYLAIACVSYGAWQSWWMSVLILTVLLGRCALAASARLRGTS